MDGEEALRVVVAPAEEEIYVVDWQEELRTAKTAEDFEEVKDFVHFLNLSEAFRLITSPEVLKACLDHVLTFSPELRVESMQGIFYYVADSFRIDLMEVFFPDYLTFESLTEGEENLRHYSYFVHDVIEEGYVDVTKFFLEKGMSPNMIILAGDDSLLMLASLFGKVDIMDVLLEAKANVNHANRKGETAVFTAMMSGDTNVLDRLIMAGADLHHRNKDGDNLWHLALSAYDTEDDLEENFRRIADCNVYLDEEVYHETLEKLYYEKGDIEWIVSILHKVAEKQGFDTEEMKMSFREDDSSDEDSD